MTAVLKVQHAGPSVSVQDAGRFGYLRYGVTESGPMDRQSHALCNFALGKPDGSPLIEVSLGGLTIQCQDGPVMGACTGGAFRVMLDDKPLPPWAIFTLHPGATLHIRPGAWGSWCYLGFAGDLDAPTWLGSTSVQLNSGLCGNPVSQGDQLRISDTSVPGDWGGEIIDPTTLKPSRTIRVVMGPQDRFFDAKSLDALCTADFRLTAECNRMGLRLSGAKLAINAALDMPSEPIARGALQVPGHGDPICLMADHQTAGGYPKIATVISADQHALAQMRPGDTVRFTAVTPADAVQAARARHRQTETLKTKILDTRMSLAQRLWHSNLIGGVVNADAPE